MSETYQDILDEVRWWNGMGGAVEYILFHELDYAEGDGPGSARTAMVLDIAKRVRAATIAEMAETAKTMAEKGAQ